MQKSRLSTSWCQAVNNAAFSTRSVCKEEIINTVIGFHWPDEPNNKNKKSGRQVIIQNLDSVAVT